MELRFRTAAVGDMIMKMSYLKPEEYQKETGYISKRPKERLMDDY